MPQQTFPYFAHTKPLLFPPFQSFNPPVCGLPSQIPSPSLLRTDPAFYNSVSAKQLHLCTVNTLFTSTYVCNMQILYRLGLNAISTSCLYMHTYKQVFSFDFYFLSRIKKIFSLLFFISFFFRISVFFFFLIFQNPKHQGMRRDES